MSMQHPPRYRDGLSKRRHSFLSPSQTTTKGKSRRRSGEEVKVDRGPYPSSSRRLFDDGKPATQQDRPGWTREEDMRLLATVSELSPNCSPKDNRRKRLWVKIAKEMNGDNAFQPRTGLVRNQMRFLFH